MESYHKRKKLLEEKHGKLIGLKPLNDDIGIVEIKIENMCVRHLRVAKLLALVTMRD